MRLVALELIAAELFALLCAALLVGTLLFSAVAHRHRAQPPKATHRKPVPMMRTPRAWSSV